MEIMEIEGKLSVRGAGHYGWYISNGNSTYLLVDGTISEGTTKTVDGVHSYWSTRREAQEFLDTWEG